MQLNKNKIISFSVLFIIIVNIGMLLAIPETRLRLLSNIGSYLKSSQKGFVNRQFIDEQGVQRKYVVYVPTYLDNNEKPPLLVFLHGDTPKGNDGFNQLRECLGPAIWEMRERFPFVVLFPQHPPETSWSPNRLGCQIVLQLIDKTQEEYNTDPGRIYLTGASTGGAGTWSIAGAYPDRFAAIAPISSGHSTSIVNTLTDAHLPVWCFYVKGDNERVVDGCREIHHSFIQSGASPIFTELDGTTSKKWWKHNAWGFAYRNIGFYSWLLRQSRSKNAEQQNFFTPIAPNEESLKSFAQTGSGQWSFNSEGILSCLSKDDDQTNCLTYSNDSQNFELHLEFRMNPESRTQLLFHSGDGFNKGWSLVIHPAEMGSCGLYRLKGERKDLIQPSDTLGQRALVLNQWNDLRITFQENTLSVYLNGWELNQLVSDGLTNRTGNLSLCSSSEYINTDWRYLRIRKSVK
jgi:pimeloyl-ACP methyl ester carboxylesterase